MLPTHSPLSLQLCAILPSCLECGQPYLLFHISRSGKLQVLAKVLAAWHAEGHKVLLFTQTQQMLDIIEKHVVSQGYSYHRMDGGTAIAQRGRLMDDFNTNPNRWAPCFVVG